MPDAGSSELGRARGVTPAANVSVRLCSRSFPADGFPPEGLYPGKAHSGSGLTSHMRSLNRTLTSRTYAHYKTTTGTSGGTSKL